MGPRILFALATVCLGAGCAEPPPLSEANAAIVGGKPVPSSAAGPAVAVVDDEIGPLCSGVLVLSDRVVTAAHCVDDARPEWLTVVVGDEDLLDGAPRGSVLSVRSIELYPNYRRDFDGSDPNGLDERHDLALLQLEGDVFHVDNAPILPEIYVDDVLVPGTPLTVAGFGVTDEASTERGRLHVASTPFVRRRGGELLAGGEGEADTCGGDSGGPAFVDVEGVRYLVGITSRAATRGCGEGGIYTLAPQYEWWMIAPESAPAYAGEERSPDDTEDAMLEAEGLHGVITCSARPGPARGGVVLWLVLLGLGVSRCRARRAGATSA